MIPFNKNKSLKLKDVEVFYLIEPKTEISDADTENENLQEIDYT